MSGQSLTIEREAAKGGAARAGNTKGAALSFPSSEIVRPWLAALRPRQRDDFACPSPTRSSPDRQGRRPHGLRHLGD